MMTLRYFVTPVVEANFCAHYSLRTSFAAQKYGSHPEGVQIKSPSENGLFIWYTEAG